MRKLFFVLFIVPILLISNNSLESDRAEDLRQKDISKHYTKQIIRDDILNLNKDKNSKAVKFLDKVLKEDNKLFNDSVLTRISNIADKYKIKPSWIIMVMFKESRANPKAINPFSNAAGIIQFMPSTARSLGTSTEEIVDMSLYQQLKYVDKYIKQLGKSHLINSYEDFYLSIFYPKALGKDPSYIIGSKGSEIVRQNKVAKNRNGYITVKSFKAYALI